MIIHMNGTNTAGVSLRLDELREIVGSSAFGRVLTFIIIAKNVGRARDTIVPATGAARAHPCHTIAALPVDGKEPKVDAELRIGPEAGPSEIAIPRCSNDSADNLETLVIPLFPPNAPVVIWWVQDASENPSRTPIGTMAQRRITTVQNSGVPADEILRRVRDGYTPGDTDLAWTSVTFWRNHLAAMFDESPHEVVERAVVCDSRTHPAVVFPAARLALRLEVPVGTEHTQGTAIDGVFMLRSPGELRLDHPIGSDLGDMVCLDREVQRVNLVMCTMESKMIERLREMAPDIAYEEVLKYGPERVLPSGE